MFRNISKKVGFTKFRGEENGQNIRVWQFLNLRILFFEVLEERATRM
jgi:hypothetical protein